MYKARTALASSSTICAKTVEYISPSDAHTQYYSCVLPGNTNMLPPIFHFDKIRNCLKFRIYKNDRLSVQFLFHSVASREDFTRKPLYSQATSSDTTGSSSSHSTKFSTSSYTGHSVQLCQADGCNNLIHIDPQLGDFSYCSPRCRDVHILPTYNEKLKADISEFEANPSTSHKVKKFDVFRMIDIETRPKELAGLTFVQLNNKKVFYAIPLITIEFLNYR